jgi:hypothetical protein
LEREASPTEGQASPFKREASFFKREASPPEREASFFKREASPSKREASLFKREALLAGGKASRGLPTFARRLTTSTGRSLRKTTCSPGYWKAVAGPSYQDIVVARKV